MLQSTLFLKKYFEGARFFLHMRYIATAGFMSTYIPYILRQDFQNKIQVDSYVDMLCRGIIQGCAVAQGLDFVEVIFFFFFFFFFVQSMH